MSCSPELPHVHPSCIPALFSNLLSRLSPTQWPPQICSSLCCLIKIPVTFEQQKLVSVYYRVPAIGSTPNSIYSDIEGSVPPWQGHGSRDTRDEPHRIRLFPFQSTPFYGGTIMRSKSPLPLQYYTVEVKRYVRIPDYVAFTWLTGWDSRKLRVPDMCRQTLQRFNSHVVTCDLLDQSFMNRCVAKKTTSVRVCAMGGSSTKLCFGYVYPSASQTRLTFLLGILWVFYPRSI